MKWTMDELGLMQVLTFPEWILMAFVFFLLIVAFWGFIKFLLMTLDLMRGK